MRRLVNAMVAAIAASMVAMAVLVVVYAGFDPPFSALMVWRFAGGQGIDYRPVPLDAIAPALAHAVLTAEDNRFCEHDGVDWQAVETVIDEVSEGGEARGASTVTMQTAKNLFLWPSRSVLRKGLEVPLALMIDLVWSKRRTIEVYLNIVEWGPGIYGAEAAAQRLFGRAAAKLTPRQAARLAAVLPAPLVRNAAEPGRGTRRIAERIAVRMRNTRGLFDCIGVGAGGR